METVIQSPPRIGMGLADFLARFAEHPFELINGEIIPMVPTSFHHDYLSNEIVDLLNAYAKPRGFGRAFTNMTFALVDEADADWVTGARIADVLYLSAEKLEAYRQKIAADDTKPLLVIPDVAVEVLSPTDRFSEVQTKVKAYLTDGVKLVWVIDRANRQVWVYDHTAPNQSTRLTDQDHLTGGSVIEGFTVAVQQIFG